MNSPNIVLLAENDELELYRVQSESNDELTYGVDIDKREGTFYCDCPDFRYRKQTEKWGGAKLTDSSNQCKHIKRVMKIRNHRMLNYFKDTFKEVVQVG